jgi:hypothetical protein
VTHLNSNLRRSYRLLFKKTDVGEVGSRSLLKARNYVAWTGRECENEEKLLSWKYVKRLTRTS